MKLKLIVRVSALCLMFVGVIGLIYYLKSTDNEVDVSLLKDRNQYISKYNKRICKYDIVEIQMERKSNTVQEDKKILKLSEGDWTGRGDAPLDLVEKSIDDFCNIKIRDELDIEQLKAPIAWTEDIEFVFSDQSRIKAQLSKKGIIKIGNRHYFTIHLLELIKHL